MFPRSRLLLHPAEKSIENPDRLTVIPQMGKRERRPSEPDQTNPRGHAVPVKWVHSFDLPQEAFQPLSRGPQSPVLALEALPIIFHAATTSNSPDFDNLT